MDIKSFQFCAYSYSTTLVIQRSTIIAKRSNELLNTPKHDDTLCYSYLSLLKGLFLHQGMIPTHPQIRRIQHQKRHHNHWECPHLPPLHHWLSTPILAIRGPTCLDTSLPMPSLFPSNQIPTSLFHKGIISQCNSGG